MTCKRTKIVCTLGPASRSPEVLAAMIEAGMDVARLNFSHGTHAEHARMLATLREVSTRLGKRVAVLQDLSGPKLRIGSLTSETIELVPEMLLTLTARDVPGDLTAISVNDPDLIDVLKPGDCIFLADGEFQLEVLKVEYPDALCRVVVGGDLRAHKGISAPGVSLKKAVPTPKDVEDMLFGIEHEVDWVALSFVRCAEEIRTLRSLIRSKGADIPIMAKLEKREAMSDLDAIIQEADGVMIARGDMALEIGLPEVPFVQKDIIQKAALYGKPEVTATQMLESMMTNPRPTRAEVSDIANAIVDGTDAVMLSGETAVGQYPVEAVRMMSQVARVAEGRIHYSEYLQKHAISPLEDTADAIARAACQCALAIGAKAIICCTRSGQTARLIAKYRPQAIIAVVSPYEKTLQRSILLWGTYPIKTVLADDTDAMIRKAEEAVLQSGIAQKGDKVIIVAGTPINDARGTNMIKADVL